MTSSDSMASAAAHSVERAAIVGLAFGERRRRLVDASLEELAGLTVTAGAVVAHRSIQVRRTPDAACFVGRGKARLLARDCDAADVSVVIFDDELTSGQLRTLEEMLGRRVIDRTQLILDIFASRARTREGRLQVELAQLRYLLPRLRGIGISLSRLGGGIGTRGPGETKLESDRRRIRARISKLTRELEAVRRRRARSREWRQKRAVPTASLVGYTNAGKTSLFNRLTGSRALASSALFVTLDPLVRPVRLSGRGTVLVSDTVGFIDRLPHALVAAFRATLEEVARADLLLHVVDATEHAREQRMDAVVRVLEEDEVRAGELSRVLVFNKCDRLKGAERRRLARRYPEAVFVSARSGAGHAQLIGAMTRALQMDIHRVTLQLDDSTEDDRRRLAQVYHHGRVLRQIREGGRLSVEADVPIRMARQWGVAASE